MFLDEELIYIVREAEIDSPEDVQETYKKLIKTCEKYVKDRMDVGMSTKDIKTILDRTFNLWDSFVRTSLKEEGQVKIIGELCQKFNFKKMFMDNDQVSQIYKQL